MVTTSYKVMCLPITHAKKQKLLQYATEYARVYNFTAGLLPSLPAKYYESTNPSLLYNKWITTRGDGSQPLKSDILSGLQMLNAIKDACANYKTIKQLPDLEFKKAKKHMHIETPNIIKFENSEYDIVMTKSEKGIVHFGIAIGPKKKLRELKGQPEKKGHRELFLPLRTNTIENEELRKKKGKEWGLIEHLELGMKMKIAKKERNKELAKERKKNKETGIHAKRARNQKAGLGVITYNLKENTISIPVSISSPKFKKKDEIKTFIGVNRGVRNSAAAVAIRIDEHQLNKLKEYQELVGMPIVSRYIFDNLNNLGGIIEGVKIINSSFINDKKQHLRKVNQKRQEAGKKVGHRLKNISDTVSHQISAELVNFASRFESPIVFFEDLSNIKQKKLRRKYGGTSNKNKRKMLSRWDYGNIKKKTLYKLEAVGIWSMDMNPSFVSQICHKCGDTKGTKDSTHFKCNRCGLGITNINKDATRKYEDATREDKKRKMDATRTVPLEPERDAVSTIVRDATIVINRDATISFPSHDKDATSISWCKDATLNENDTIVNGKDATLSKKLLDATDKETEKDAIIIENPHEDATLGLKTDAHPENAKDATLSPRNELKDATENKSSEDATDILYTKDATTKIPHHKCIEDATCHKCIEDAIMLKKSQSQPINVMLNMDRVGSNPNNIVGQYNANVNSSINIALKGLYSLYRYREEIPWYGYEVGSVADPYEQPDENVMKPIPTVMTGIKGIKTRKSGTVTYAHDDKSRDGKTKASANADTTRSTLCGSARPTVNPPGAGGSKTDTSM